MEYVTHCDMLICARGLGYLAVLLSFGPQLALSAEMRPSQGGLDRSFLCENVLDRQFSPVALKPQERDDRFVQTVAWDVSGFEIETYRLYPGLVAQVRRPKRAVLSEVYLEKHGLITENLEANFKAHQAYVSANVKVAKDAFARRETWRKFLENRDSTGLRYIPDSTYFTVYEEATGRELGSMRLMNHPYGIKDGKLVPSYEFGSLKDFNGFREHDILESGIPFQPKLYSSAEEYLNIVIPRISTKSGLPVDKEGVSHRILREIGNFAIVEGLSPEIHGEVYAQLWTLMTTELVKGDTRSPFYDIDSQLIIYGDQTSIVHYRPTHFRVAPEFGVISKDGVDWRLLTNTVDRLLLFNHALIVKGRPDVRSKRFIDLRTTLRDVSLEGPETYAFVQNPSVLYEQFLDFGNRMHQLQAQIALGLRLTWIKGRPLSDQVRLGAEVQAIFETLKRGLLSSDVFIRYDSVRLMSQGFPLPQFKDFFQTPEAIEFIRKELGLLKELIATNANRSIEQMAVSLFMEQLKLSETLDFSNLWHLLNDVYGAGKVSQFSSTVGMILYHTFRTGEDSIRAKAILQELANFIGSEPSLSPKITSELIGWYKEIYGSFPSTIKLQDQLPETLYVRRYLRMIGDQAAIQSWYRN